MAYYCRRSLPFFIIYVAYEALEVGFLVLLGGNDAVSVDNSLIFLGFLNDTLISFIFCLLPYLLYLSALPFEFHNGRKDRVVSLALFSAFCLLNTIEELPEALSGDSRVLPSTVGYFVEKTRASSGREQIYFLPVPVRLRVPLHLKEQVQCGDASCRRLSSRLTNSEQRRGFGDDVKTPEESQISLFNTVKEI